MKKKIAVIGAGPSGISAALALQENGFDPVVLEREDHAGGKTAEFSCKAADKCLLCGTCIAADKAGILDVEEIDVRYNTTVTSVRSMADDVILGLSDGKQLECWGVIIAAGYDNYDPGIDVEYNYGVHPDIITGYDCERILREKGNLLKPSDSSIPSDVAFILCVGSRDIYGAGNYCSQVCCKYTLRIAGYLIDKNPDINITVYYIDIQKSEPDFKQFFVDNRENINLIQGRAVVEDNFDSMIRVRYRDDEQGIMQRVDHDMLILSTGIQALKENEAFADMFSLPVDENGFLHSRGKVRVCGTSKKPMSIRESITSGEKEALVLINEIQDE